MVEPSLYGTYEGGVRTNPDDLVPLERSYRSVYASSEMEKRERYTSENDCLDRISSDRGLEGSQGRNSDGGSTSSPSCPVCKLQREDLGGDQRIAHTVQGQHSHQPDRFL